ncbi:hypothetical protein ABPG77_004821 [Micractinium sp. CCAP 211/92]
MRCTPSLLVSALARLLLLLGTRAREDETMHVLSTLQHSLMGVASGGPEAAAAQAMWSSVGALAGSQATPRPAPVLAYITPWNGAGYELAKRHRCRLHLLSPVWFQLRALNGAPQLTGAHNVNVGWMEALRAPCPEASSNTDGGGLAPGRGDASRVLPRVIFEIGGPDLGAILARPREVASLLADVAQEHGFDGWVVEAWSGWAAMGVTQHAQARGAALELLRQLAAQLHSAGRALVLAVSPLLPAPGRPAQLTAGDAAELLGFVDALSVMTYDHATQQPGPNAPLPWVVQNADAFASVADRLPSGSARSKVLLGIPFYGNEYSFRGKQLERAEAVTSKRLLEVLAQKASLENSAAAAGPAEAAVSETTVAAERGLGVSVWELGQGVEEMAALL